MNQASMLLDAELIKATAQEMVRYGQAFYTKNWNLATSSNYSAVLSAEPLRLLMTASGFHKGDLTEDDFVVVDENLRKIALPGAAPGENLRPSAEAALHVALAKQTGAGAVLHTHSIWATIVAERYFTRGHVELRDYEMLKALSGVKSHEVSVRIVILENSQDMTTLGNVVSQKIESGEIVHAFLLRGHGLYTWAGSLAEARNQVEALEFLFEVVGRSGES